MEKDFEKPLEMAENAPKVYKETTDTSGKSGSLEIKKCILSYVVHTFAIITGYNLPKQFSSPYFINFGLTGIIFVAALLILALILIINRSIIIDTIIKFYKKLIKRPIPLLLMHLTALVLIATAGSGVVSSIIPVFEITSPKESDEVGQLISVKGHGAILGSEIEVFVIDDLGTTWRAGSTFSKMEKVGGWELRPVLIGRPGDEDKGQMYEIYALLKTPERNYSTKHIRVTRI